MEGAHAAPQPRTPLMRPVDAVGRSGPMLSATVDGDCVSPGGWVMAVLTGRAQHAGSPFFGEGLGPVPPFFHHGSSAPLKA